MTEPLSFPFQHADTAITYTIGAPPGDWTHLHVGADGGFELRSTATAGRQGHHFSGTLTAEQINRVTAELRDGQLWASEHVRKRGPGETAARIELICAGRSKSVELWTREVALVPAFHRATAVLVELIHDVSGGVILEPGR